MCKENNPICNCIFNILTSLLVAIGVAAVFYIGLVTSITTLLYITLILGILSIVYIIVSIFCKKSHNCDCFINSNLIPSAIGALVSSLFALTITTLATFSIPVAILIGVTTFFLISLLISLINTLICIFCRNRYCDKM